MALHTIVAGRAWLYSHNIGRNAQAGMGFSNPVGVAVTNDGIAYVANRSGEQNPSSRISKVNYTEQEFITEFGRTGPAYGGGGSHHFTWLTGVALDSEEKVYTSDEWKSQISIFDNEGNLLSVWGEKGSGAAQLDGPAGIALDADETLWIVDCNNGRVQHFTKDGQHLGSFGEPGEAEGQFNMPYGITLDAAGNIYIADWGNHRVQKFSPDGTFLLTFGHPGPGAGSLNHPTGVCVDNEGDVYVVDWMNERVVIYDEDTKPITYLYGDAVEVSNWGQLGLDANPDMVKRRNQVWDQVDQQRKFRLPTGCAYDRKNDRLLVCDTQRGRLQVYIKDHSYSDPQFNL